jgi:predicted amino acid dehydrogenase
MHRNSGGCIMIHINASDKVKFVLLGHPASYDHFVRFAEDSGGVEEPERLRRHSKTLTKLIDWVPSYVTKHRLVIQLNGSEVEGRLVVCPFLPERVSLPQSMKRAHEKVVQGCRLAKDLGAEVIALGGFTSILEGAHGNKLAQKFGLTITSGNCLTAAIAVEQLRGAVARWGRSLDSEPVAVVGATGDIGRVCTQLLAGTRRKLILVARNRRKLEELRHRLPSSVEAVIATEPEAAFGAGIIVAATSSAVPLFRMSDVPTGSIICDVGYPKTFSQESTTRDDVLVIAGGLAELPSATDIQAYLNLSSPDLIFGCFAEGIVLAARPDLRALSAQQGEAEAGRAMTLLAAATELGIRPAGSGADMPLVFPQPVDSRAGVLWSHV